MEDYENLIKNEIKELKKTTPFVPEEDNDAHIIALKDEIQAVLEKHKSLFISLEIEDDYLTSPWGEHYFLGFKIKINSFLNEKGLQNKAKENLKKKYKIFLESLEGKTIKNKKGTKFIVRDYECYGDWCNIFCSPLKHPEKNAKFDVGETLADFYKTFSLVVES